MMMMMRQDNWSANTEWKKESKLVETKEIAKKTYLFLEAHFVGVGIDKLMHL